ncbi:fimbria/pilus outer membrane usher protein [Martelella alba]|uniref:Fimbrial biogenesis outer membrane usher protein n=1 Tax=Martelella alba TaxID=2590451 RepID=A0ABY2SQZ6_9HYPH|nr:fimbria/pilus outer membrane usher protein [Martelella alba]TKI07246.1 fimbrial biogenesis outer membrane usher protein [Martelella alba]
MAVLSRRRWVLTGYCGLLPFASHPASFDGLPPPPTLAADQARRQYLLALAINEADSGFIIPVIYDNGHYYAETADLIRAGLPAGRLNGPRTDLSALSDVSLNHDGRRQKLMLTVPTHWLPGRELASGTGRPRHPAKTSTGALLNYDIYGSRINGGGPRFSAWNEWRIFGETGHFSTDGVAQWQSAGRGNHGYIRYDTFWANQNEEHALSWKAGDLITDALSWGSSVRIGGVQIARDFAVRPDIVTYPLPAFSGQAAVPSMVDLFIDGYRTGGEMLRPGPYTFTNLPFVNGAGEAVIVTTDALGRQTTTAQPFYVSSQLLKPGLTDYSVAAGALRRQYGIQNVDYATLVASGSYRRGINDMLTLEGHAEGAPSQTLGGAGGVFKLHRWGAANAALSVSRAHGERGGQYDWGYQYSARRFNLGTQHTQRSGGFRNLAALGANDHHLHRLRWSLSRRSGQYYASFASDRLGSFGLAYIDVRSAQGGAAQLTNFSWSRNLLGDASLFASASHDRLRREWSGVLTLVMPVRMLVSASLGMERDAPGGIRQRAAVSRAMPTDGGLGWDLSYARQPGIGDYRQGTLHWRNTVLETAGGFYASGDQQTQWGDIAGALVLMDSHLLAANALNNTFALVKTNYPGIAVSYENQPAGSTNPHGYLLIPGVSAYYPAKYGIDTLTLPPDLTTDEVEQRVAIRRRSGYLVSFPVKSLRAANVIFHDKQGLPLPVGTRLLRDNRPADAIGWDGIAWLENLTADNPMRAITPDGRQCETRLILPEGGPRPLTTYGPLSCPLPAAP